MEHFAQLVICIYVKNRPWTEFIFTLIHFKSQTRTRAHLSKHCYPRPIDIWKFHHVSEEENTQTHLLKLKREYFAVDNCVSLTSFLCVGCIFALEAERSQKSLLLFFFSVDPFF